MTRALDSQALRGADACEEGLSWLEAQGGRLSLEDDGAVEAAVEASPGFAAWAFFHMPALRGALGEARLAALAGPQHAALAALFDALRATPLLGGGAADEVIQVEVEAHLRALARLPLKLGLRAPVPITRVNLYDAWGLCPPAEEGLPPPPQAWIEGWWRAHGDEVTAAPLYRRRRADPRATARAWLWSQVEPIQARAEWVGRFIGAAAFRAAFRGARGAGARGRGALADGAGHRHGGAPRRHR
ncbi:hypothetical protein KJ940_00065 [Myxococcota bacterium]|nr:hypothetical protein [Myxococcota bacterium]